MGWIIGIPISLIPIWIIIAIYRWLHRIPDPISANPKEKMDCSTPTTGTGVSVFDHTTTGGVIKGQQITLAAGETATLTRSLTVIADGDLIVAGKIEVPPLPPGASPVDINLISNNGKVVIAAGARVDAGLGAFGLTSLVRGLYARAVSTAGGNGGLIRIKGVNIEIAGIVSGATGGRGGVAQAIGASFWVFGGFAAAVAGEGGFGGDVILCAVDSIAISGQALSGFGGDGALGLGQSSNGSDAYGQGGQGNDAGNLTLTGLGGTPCQVFFIGSGRVVGSPGGNGGNGRATGRPAPSGFSGGNATAVGGHGGKGGTVFFNNVVVVPPPTGSAKASIGGNGGAAQANAGAGGRGGITPLVQPGSGGDAWANGGDGGESGKTPSIPQSTGATVLGTPAAPIPGLVTGSGGNASATGGAAGAPGILSAAASGGTSHAQGGANGAGLAATPVTSPPVGPAPVLAFSPGTP
jgi:hypothetical protein